MINGSGVLMLGVSSYQESPRPLHLEPAQRMIRQEDAWAATTFLPFIGAICHRQSLSVSFTSHTLTLSHEFERYTAADVVVLDSEGLKRIVVPHPLAVIEKSTVSTCLGETERLQQQSEGRTHFIVRGSAPFIFPSFIWNQLHTTSYSPSALSSLMSA